MNCSPYELSPDTVAFPGAGANDFGQDVSAPASWPTIVVKQCLPTLLNYEIQDATLDDVGSFTNGVGGSSEEYIRLFFKTHHGSSDLQIVGGARADANDPYTISFDFNSDQVASPGIFVGELVIYTSTDGGTVAVPENAAVPSPSGEADTAEVRPVYSKRVYVEVTPNSISHTPQPLTIAEVRLALRDESPASNYLLDEFEYTDKEIMHAIHRCVDYWNEALPPVSPLSYASFPYKFHWLQGTMGLLLKRAGLQKLRNWLPYSAAGLSVQDQSTWSNYAQLGESYWNEYREWVRERKIALNIAGAYGYRRGGQY